MIIISRDHAIDNTGCICRNEEAAADIGYEYQERLPYLSSHNPFVRVNYIVFTDGYKLLTADQLINSIPKLVGIWRLSDIEVVHGMKNSYVPWIN